MGKPGIVSCWTHTIHKCNPRFDVSTCVFCFPASQLNYRNYKQNFCKILVEEQLRETTNFLEEKGCARVAQGNGRSGRNMRAYNLALQAKQAMRIHERKDSLISRVLFSKYKVSLVTQGLKGTKIVGAPRDIKGCARQFTNVGKALAR